MLRRLSVRGKILAALAVPVVVLFVAAVYIVSLSVGDARQAAGVRELVEFTPQQDAALDALEAERLQAIAYLRREGGTGERIVLTRSDTDNALAARDAALRKLGVGSLDARVAKAAQDTLGARDAVDTIRRQINTGGVDTDYVERAYSAIIDKAIALPQSLADTATDRGLAQYLQTYVLAERLVDHTSLETLSGGNLLRDSEGLSNDLTAIRDAGIVSRAVTVAGTIEAGDDQLASVNTALASVGLPTLAEPSGQYLVLRKALAAANASAASKGAADAWTTLSTQAFDTYAHTRDVARDATADKAQSLQRSATVSAVVTGLVALAVFAASVALALGIARRIVRPLRHLTAAASNVSTELPNLVEQVAEPGRAPDLELEEIPVESDDEVGALARAFNDVNATTIKVAREQAALRGSIAEMFVNVARRDQVLLNRQLSFLDDLERTEEDPGSLANLFRLDHLATRMRRNAESLLVLAGIDSGRRVRQPMPTSDVIRTASSEIEMYDRVRLILPVDPMMLGHNALSAAHLVAELLENATRFSEPHTPVEVATDRGPDAVRVVIRDHGLGMSAEELEEARARVASSGASEMIGAQRLGLYVVGRLAARLGAVVEFASEGRGTDGTTVVVSFPVALFVHDEQVPLPQPTDPLAAETQAAAAALTGSAAPTEPQPVVAGATGAGAEAWALPSAEPEVAVPVDIDALTDGTTASGMPRRRTARADAATAGEAPADGAGTTAGSYPAAAAGAGSLGADLSDAVLPEVALPEVALPEVLPGAFGGADDQGWAPPTVVGGAPLDGGGLPTRRRAGSPSTGSQPAAPVFGEPRPVTGGSAFGSPAGLPVREPAKAPEPAAQHLPPLAVPPLAPTEAAAGELVLPASPAAPAQLPDLADVQHVEVPEDVVRTSMFSGFRSMNQLVAGSAPSHGTAPDDSPAATNDSPAPSVAAEPPAAAEPSVAVELPVAAEVPAAEPHDRAELDEVAEPSAVDAVEEAREVEADRAPVDADADHGDGHEGDTARSAAVDDDPVLDDEGPAFAPALALEGSGLPSRGGSAPSAPADAVAPLWTPAPERTDAPSVGAAQTSTFADLAGYFTRREAAAPEQPAAAPAAAWQAPAASAAAEQVPTVPAMPGAANAVPAMPEAADAVPAVPEQSAPAPVAPVPVVQAEPVAAATPVQVAPDGLDEELASEALPPFDELLTNLPTRRSVREAARRNRGWFRRGYSQRAYAEALSTMSRPTPVVGPDQVDQSDAAPALPAEPAQPVAPARPVSPAQVPAAGAGAVPGDGRPAAPARVSMLRPELAQLAAATTRTQAPTSNPATSLNPAPSVNPAPSANAAASANPVPAGTPGPGGSASGSRTLDPLDPEYTLDPEAARSEWLASAVVYEEMTSLLRSPGPVGTGGAEPSYEPASVDLGAANGLTRRARRQRASDEGGRHAAQIERDAEVLRERLRSFQSSTRRGREDGAAAGPDGASPIGEPLGTIDLDAEFQATFGDHHTR